MKHAGIPKGQRHVVASAPKNLNPTLTHKARVQKVEFASGRVVIRWAIWRGK